MAGSEKKLTRKLKIVMTTCAAISCEKHLCSAFEKKVDRLTEIYLRLILSKFLYIIIIFYVMNLKHQWKHKIWFYFPYSDCSLLITLCIYFSICRCMQYSSVILFYRTKSQKSADVLVIISLKYMHYAT